MAILQSIRRHGFTVALAASIAVHGGIALCAFRNSDTDAEVAPFRRGRTTVSLRPTFVERADLDPIEETSEVPPDLEPTPVDASATRQFVSAPRLKSDAAPPAPLHDPAVAEPVSRERPTTTQVEPPAVESRPTAVRRPPDIAVPDEVLQPFVSQQREGGKNDAEATVHTQPSPPFPPHLPHEPVRLRMDYTIDADGRFRDVKVASGDADSDALIAGFIQRRWRAKPATRFGRPVSKTYSGYLNFE